MFTKQGLMNALLEIGAAKGDILVVQSSYKGMGGLEEGPETFCSAAADVLGAGGTLVMPTYNFTSWTDHGLFSYADTLSLVGAITEYFRTREGTLRTRHPIHSLGVVGGKAKDLLALDDLDSFGPKSTFAYLLSQNALLVTVGTGTKMPFLHCHYPETDLKVPYRKPKLFTGEYTDALGHKKTCEYGFHVRINRQGPLPVYKAHELLCERGIVTQQVINGVEFCYSRAKTYDAGMRQIIGEFPSMFQ